ncbi:diacylglycerol kinase family protein [Streptomyces turgidiscabies]|uniref:diacylglycerol kinase family protein n=1 Tax=Streptomyces turgidiscabies TaxID=85558 RepID=UPI0005CAA8DB|nr:diacylglycerol kinase family protein [Streptomyces turgidiscabies]MDX3499149.1 diacylglycerol kinase family protein [Streptomyces turgidiscabies]
MGTGVSNELFGRAHARQRWAARGALGAAGLAVLLPIGYAGMGSLLLAAVGVGGAVLTASSLWWALARRGLVRGVGVVLAVATPVGVVALFAAANLLWPATASLALWGAAVWAGKFALSSTRSHVIPVREYEAPAPLRPFLLMNPRSGDGKVERFRLREKAERLGARVHLIDPGKPEPEDVVALAREAVAEGADLLGVAGGDGTQALVAGVAAEHDLPFLVVSAGTRNHFAMDLGLDRDDPATCLDALTDAGGVELRVDLGYLDSGTGAGTDTGSADGDGDGTADSRPFVNNASFGAYASIVQSPAYRDDKVGTTLGLLPELLTFERGATLTARAYPQTRVRTGEQPGETVIHAPQAVLVSNNPYRMDDFAGLGRRERLDAGALGVLGIKVEDAAQAAELLLGRYATGLTVVTAHEVVVEADLGEIEVGLDGEALVLPTPVRCRVEPGALRVRVPRHRPGVPAPTPPMDWRRLRKLAATVGRTALPRRTTDALDRRRQASAPQGRDGA